MRCDLGANKFGRNPKDDPMEYKGRRIDVMPYSIKEFDDIADPVDAVKQWLEKGWNIIKEIEDYDKKTINKAIEEWSQQNGVEREFHSPFLATKAVVVIYPEKYLGKILWVNPKLKK